ncbi:c-type cytochrome [Campylobacter fetus]|uniref:C-type cytochrome n=4 Tax=Campylobacter fetus TaxID=196 RepID=A0A5L4LF09_CAMFE|nr:MULTISPECIES: c-type cytochrome [Campylobacter]OCS22622.1 cytochrome C [Campylobacter fetus subsp. venerealis cfvi97/532]OCS26950.1 cytochrome C [Campylobacter fetus subsp. venerealis cfvB10]OCS30084.1 cytochrome C [Campylobacter fetus subsp. venerealis LMG 6570 = CCUG 33900]OCS43308.1 cytochrome C [Campylobacter fetus subsp. venerealis cfvi02/298]ABK81920.1 cytochrome c553 [Campylobacter fetus subsp. fetus 82-40]
MKNFLLVLACGAFACSAFAADGATIYKKCATCHGLKAEKKYLNKVPVLTEVDAATRLADMKEYKAGTLNAGKGKFGMGGIMKGQMATLSEEDMAAVNDYISTLK